ARQLRVSDTTFSLCSALMGGVCCCGPCSPRFERKRQSTSGASPDLGRRAMNLLGHTGRLAGGLCKALRLQAGAITPARVLAMSKRTASGAFADAAGAASLSRPNSSSAASPQQPSNKRRRLQPVAAGPSAAQTTVTSTPKAASSPKAQAKPQAAKAEDDGGMWLIVGLGNPGAMYENTRHNVGFMVLDELARQASIDCRKLEKGAAVGRGELAGRPVLLAKPATFMNNSGEAVGALARFYRVSPGRLLVLADDLDLPLAQVRLRQKGGHGGHNGLRSIIDRLGGSSDFPRIKVGIGRPTGHMPIASYVLQPFSKSERPEVEVAVQECVTLVRSILTLGLEKAASGQRV
ncbi:hypothetical protein Agub_g11561, partial [Astrephomene gubernaculifera]